MSFLNDVFCGQNSPANVPLIKNEACQQAYEEIKRAEKKFLKRHRCVSSRDLIILHDAYSPLLSFYSEYFFQSGVRFCARFLTDALQSE